MAALQGRVRRPGLRAHRPPEQRAVSRRVRRQTARRWPRAGATPRRATTRRRARRRCSSTRPQLPAALRQDGGLADCRERRGGRPLALDAAIVRLDAGRRRAIGSRSRSTWSTTKSARGATPAERIAYFIALHDFNDNGPRRGGNVLIDGNPAGGAAVHVDYPGADAKAGRRHRQRQVRARAQLRRAGHERRRRQVSAGTPGRLACPRKNRSRWRPTTLPDGGFGFEYCCGRSFVVDNVLVERSAAERSRRGQRPSNRPSDFENGARSCRRRSRPRNAERGERPGKIAWVTDREPTPPDVFLLERGNYATPGEKVEPAPLAALDEPATPLEIDAPSPDAATSRRRRLAWARWLTRAGSRPAALLARVQVNRIWQHHFGAGIVATTENLGASGVAAVAPRIARLSGRRVRPLGLEHEGHAPAAAWLGRLSPDERAATRRRLPSIPTIGCCGAIR